MTEEKFESFDPQQIAAMPAFQTVVTGPDQIWVTRISGIAVGGGFRVHREEGETARQVKRRVNAAADVSFKQLMWKPEQTNLPEGQEPRSWVVKVKSLDLKAKAAAEAKNASNPSPDGSQPTPPTQNAQSDGSSAEVAGRPARPR